MITQTDNDSYEQSIWKLTNPSGDLKLVFNHDKSNDKKDELKVINDIGTKKALKLGSLVMSPKGIGRLIKLESKFATIKFLKTNEEECVFEEDQILNEFPIYIRILHAEFSNWYKIIVQPNGSIEALKKQIEELNIVDPQISNYYLIYNGIELRDESFFDQVDLQINAKILLCGLKLTSYSLKRFTVTYTWWYASNCDGISFLSNKKIRLTGIGLFGSHEAKTLTGNLKFFEGMSNSIGTVFCDEPFEVPPAPDATNCITPYMFRKPINIKPGIDYSIQLTYSGINPYAYIYYGSGGKTMIEGEKGVEFTFKYTGGSYHSTGVESGNFPELYYYA